MHVHDIKALTTIQTICDYLVRFFALLLAILVFCDVGPALQFVWASIILTLIGSWWAAQVGIWAINWTVSRR